MAYPYPVQRYREFQNWIPASDADGIDAKESIICDSENIDFENGFISNARKPTNVNLPSDVENAITVDGYELLSSKFFTHSEKNNVEFYLLYKYSSGHLLRYFVHDDDGTVELDIDYENSDVTIASKPTLITYSLMQNQLKVNLNVVGRYNTLSKNVYLNLTLSLAVPENGFNRGGHSRGEWHLSPRWLGWSFSSIVNAGTGGTETTLDFEGSISHGVGAETVTSGTGAGLGTWGDASGQYLDLVKVTNSPDTSWLKIAGVVKASKLSFRLHAPFISSETSQWLNTMSIKITDDSDGSIVYEKKDYSTTTAVESFELVLPRVVDSATILFTGGGFSSSPYSRVWLDDVVISYADSSNVNYCLVAKYFDQQRALIEHGAKAISYTTTFRVNKTDIDHRVKEFELYIQQEEDGLYRKYLVIPIFTSSWVDGGTYYEWTPSTSDWIDLAGSGVETLNFNYGLGETIYVVNIPQNDDPIGFPIYRECLYRGRNYYVKYDENLYYSHISGTGLPQPDSFPMLILDPIGYILISNQSKCVGVAVTSLDELIVETDNKAYLYNIEYSSGGTAYRKRRAINGSFGLGSVNSLVTDLDGTPKDEILFWSNKWGMYIYGGGIQAPKDIVYSAHRNYWKDIPEATKGDMLSFYNPQRREIWNVLDDIIVIYELPTNTFRKYRLDFKIVDYVGEKDKYAYVLGDDSKIYKLDPKASTRLNGFIETHYTTNTIVIGQYPISAWEFQHKIMQDIYIAYKDTSAGQCSYRITIDDDIVITPDIVFNTNISYEVLRSPLLVRYGKVKIRITIPASPVKIKEFGYAFSVPSQGDGSRNTVQAGQGIGQQTGMGVGIGL